MCEARNLKNMGNIEKMFSEWKALQPLKQEDQTRLDRKFMLEFNYNSNHIEGNTLTYGQTELLLIFGKVVNEANMRDLEEMKAHNVGLKMIQDEARISEFPLTEMFIRQLHHTLLREDYTVYHRQEDGSTQASTIHAGQYKTKPNSVITVTGERFEYASPEETPALMTDLVDWYNSVEKEGRLSPIEIASLFHYRYIRIHPFEDGNGRIARLMINYIFARHGYPMIIVQSKDKDHYLTALNLCDIAVGNTPSVGAHAPLEKIEPFVNYINDCMETALTICIKAAKGESIEEENDFDKELTLLKKEEQYKKKRTTFNEMEVWNIAENVFFPIAKEYQKVIEQVKGHFPLLLETRSVISKGVNSGDSLHIDDRVNEKTAKQEQHYFAKQAKSLIFDYSMDFYRIPLHIEGDFNIHFEKEYYFTNAFPEKQYAYGSYLSTDEMKEVIASFKTYLMKSIKDCIE